MTRSLTHTQIHIHNINCFLLYHQNMLHTYCFSNCNIPLTYPPPSLLANLHSLSSLLPPARGRILRLIWHKHIPHRILYRPPAPIRILNMISSRSLLRRNRTNTSIRPSITVGYRRRNWSRSRSRSGNRNGGGRMGVYTSVHEYDVGNLAGLQVLYTVPDLSRHH